MRSVLLVVLALGLVLLPGCGEGPEARPTGGDDSTTAPSGEEIAEEIAEALPRGVVVLLGDDAAHLTRYGCTEIVLRSRSRQPERCEVDLGQSTRTFTHGKGGWAEE